MADITRGGKACFPVWASISVDHDRFPFWIVGKGKIRRGEFSRLSGTGMHETDHSESGRSTENAISRLLGWLYE
jgi:hypothetical protein